MRRRSTGAATSWPCTTSGHAPCCSGASYYQILNPGPKTLNLQVLDTDDVDEETSYGIRELLAQLGDAAARRK